jgi:hypothetical protein
MSQTSERYRVVVLDATLIYGCVKKLPQMLKGKMWTT